MAFTKLSLVSLFLTLSTTSLISARPAHGAVPAVPSVQKRATPNQAAERLRAGRYSAAPVAAAATKKQKRDFTIPTFANSKADDFVVDTASLPSVSFDTPQTWAGRLPIKEGSDSQLFFWYYPSSKDGGSDSLTIWLNGGPGCSSMEGALEENGPLQFRLSENSTDFFDNKNAWTTQSDMLYIEQPVGTGFTLGTPDIQNENDLADEFYGFLGQFFGVFKELTDKKFYISGESYAGFYIPYITSRILTASDDEKANLPLDLRAIIINDGVYSSFVVSQYVPAYQFVKENQENLGISDDFLATLKNTSESCGYEDLLNSITYPPTKKYELPHGDDVPDGCETFDQYTDEASRVNKCFNIYRITDQCPTPNDPIEDYLSKAEVQKALHVDGFGQWNECGGRGGSVFPTGDNSAYTETLFPDILAKIPIYLWHGKIDSILIWQGDRITIQNLTWNGAQGFSEEPNKPLTVDGKTYGNFGSERNLTYIEVENAGHMIPEDQGVAALHVFQAVLGQVEL